MDVYEAIKNRRSIRKYLQAPVEWDKIGQILEAGKAAPSCGNLQDWRFIVILDQKKREQIAESCMQQHWMARAPVHIIVVGEPEKSKRFYGIRGERLYTIQDCAAAVQNMLLMAHALGLGSCWIGAFDEDALRNLVSMPNEIRPQAIVTIGYADEQPPEPPEYTLENIMYFREYGGQGNRVKDIPKYSGDYAERIQRTAGKGKDIFSRMMNKLQSKK